MLTTVSGGTPVSKIRLTISGPCVSAVSQGRFCRFSMPNSWLSANDGMPRMTPSMAPAMVPE